jgi:hypothetical protein
LIRLSKNFFARTSSPPVAPVAPVRNHQTHNSAGLRAV